MFLVQTTRPPPGERAPQLGNLWYKPISVYYNIQQSSKIQILEACYEVSDASWDRSLSEVTSYKQEKGSSFNSLIIMSRVV
jgi:hypothetical protein